ncbi:MAG: PKD domain-containing protein [Candidatus Methanosuratincola sp.]
MRNSNAASATAKITPVFGTREGKTGVLPPAVQVSCPTSAFPTETVTCTANTNLVRDPATGLPVADPRVGWLYTTNGNIINLNGTCPSLGLSETSSGFEKEFLMFPGTYLFRVSAVTSDISSLTMNVFDSASGTQIASSNGGCSYSGSSRYTCVGLVAIPPGGYERVKLQLVLRKNTSSTVGKVDLSEFKPLFSGKWVVQGGTSSVTDIVSINGVTDTGFSKSTQVTFSSSGQNSVAFKIWDNSLGESYAVYAKANVTVPNPITALQVSCPSDILVGETVTCQLISQANSSVSYTYAWNAGSGATIVQNNNTYIKVKWSTDGPRTVTAKMSVTGAPGVFMEASTDVNPVYDVRVTSLDCPDSVKMGVLSTCSVSAYAPFGSLRYEWIAENGNAVFVSPSASTTQFYMAKEGQQVVSVKLTVPEVQGVSRVVNKTIAVSPMDISLSVQCPEAVEKNEIFQCTASGSAEFGTPVYTWQMGPNGTPTSGTTGTVFYGRFSSLGMNSVGVKMCLQERSAICLEQTSPIEVMIRPPTVQGTSCNRTSIVLGQEIECSMQAQSLAGTVAYSWSTDESQDYIEKPEEQRTKIQLKTAGQRVVKAKAYIQEYPASYVEVPVSVEVNDNILTFEISCPENVVSKKEFTCTVNTGATWGTMAVNKWSGINVVVKSGGMNPVFVSNYSGAGTAVVIGEASLVEAPWLSKRVESRLKVVSADEVTPVIKGQKSVYVNVDYTYNASAPCLEKGTCTMRWSINGAEAEGSQITVSFPREGKYVLRVDSVFTETGDAVSSEISVYANKLPRPIISIEGPSAVFSNDPVTFRAVVSKNHETLPIVGRWIMPDGSIVEGFETTFAPSSGTGNYALVHEAWVDGFKESTLRVTEKRVTAAVYEFPMPRIVAKVTEGVAPVILSFKTEFTKKRVAGARYKITYVWDFGDGETETTENYFVSHQFSRAGTYTVRMTATDQYGNSSTDSVTVNISLPETLVSVKTVASNRHNRAPVDIVAKATVTRGSRLDRLAAFEWKVNGETVSGDVERMRITLRDPGTYEITYSAVMESGSIGVGKETVVVNPNRPPVCSLDYKVVSGYVIVTSQCSDPDGRMSSYKWDLGDGRGLRFGTTRASFKAEPGTRTVKLVVSDDCGASTETSIDITISE